MGKIVVIGSANYDISCEVEVLPKEATKEGIENVTGVLGGKGANQAVAAALQGAEVYFIGCIGNDSEGERIKSNFKKNNVEYERGTKVLNTSTDGRIIYVDKNGNNRMFGYGKCIKMLTPEIAINEELLRDADIVMIQMKMPDETIEEVIKYCKENMKTLIIDPTPIKKSGLLIEKGLLDSEAYITQNEEEAFALAMYEQGYTYEQIEKEMRSKSRDEIIGIIRDFVKKHHNIIATLGDKGVMYYNRGIREHKPYPTECIDSTGAGDTFNGTFAAAISRGEDLDTAIEYALANCANKIKCRGAQNGMQTLEETRRDIERIKTH